LWVGHSCPTPLQLILRLVLFLFATGLLMNRQTIAREIGFGLAGLLALMLPVLPAQAHNGPPFPIIENHSVGPCVISLWTHPDVGTGTFFVFVQPLPGKAVPADLKVQIGVQPESGRLPEVVYPAAAQDNRGDQLQYNAMVQFDRDEFWRVRLVLESSQGRGEEFSHVEATPVGFGKWDLLFYLLPFLAVGFLWFRGISRRRGRMKKLQAA
jgi:hypothetical protein